MRNLPMWLVTLVLVLAAAYLAVAAIVYAAQTRMMFPAHLAAAPGSPLPATARPLEVATPDGEMLRGVRIPVSGDAAGAPPVVLGFGGNAWNAADLAVYLTGLYPGAEVVAFHYRGYRPSTGTPGAAALLADALVVHDHVAEIAPGRAVVAVGFSLGTGVAAWLAANRQLAGLILVSPFDSLTALARAHYPWLPVGLLLRHRMPVAAWAPRLSLPVAVIAAGRDTIVPPRRTDALRRAIPTLVFDRTVAEAGHNDLYQHPGFRAAMAEALARLRGAGGD